MASIDARNKVTTMLSDNLDRQIGVIDPNHDLIQTVLDTVGNLDETLPK